MNVWLEIVGAFPERVGKYLICPINSSTRKDYPLYRIIEEVENGDAVFHYILERASKMPSGIYSYSFARNNCYKIDTFDPLCSSPPPYRKVDLAENTVLPKPITMDMLLPYRSDLEAITEEAGFTRTPFDKNFKIKQLYLSRIPKGFLPIFSKISRMEFNLTN